MWPASFPFDSLNFFFGGSKRRRKKKEEKELNEVTE